MQPDELDTHSKALKINLDPRWYGTLAEIGAGQEVVRWFFRVGAAAGTVAKSISAYDMIVSDAIYGSGDRYVSRSRLQAMLDREFQLNVDRLSDKRGDTTAFFAFADTVVARSFKGGNVAPELRKLYGYLADRGSFVSLDNFKPEFLSIFSRDVLKKIAAGDDEWKQSVPPEVSERIAKRRFFGCNG